MTPCPLYRGKIRQLQRLVRRRYSRAHLEKLSLDPDVVELTAHVGVNGARVEDDKAVAVDLHDGKWTAYTKTEEAATLLRELRDPFGENREGGLCPNSGSWRHQFEGIENRLVPGMREAIWLVEPHDRRIRFASMDYCPERTAGERRASRSIKVVDDRKIVLEAKAIPGA